MQTAITRINEQLNAGGGEKLEATPISSEQIEIAVPEGVEPSARRQGRRGAAQPARLDAAQRGKRKEDGKTVLVYNLEAAARRRSTWTN